MTDGYNIPAWLFDFEAGKASNQLGKHREEKTLQIIQTQLAQHSWFVAACLATKAEDGEGKDIVIQTDRGEFYVQVKSSVRRAIQWRQKHGKRLKGRCVMALWSNGKPPDAIKLKDQITAMYQRLEAHP